MRALFQVSVNSYEDEPDLSRIEILRWNAGSGHLVGGGFGSGVGGGFGSGVGASECWLGPYSSQLKSNEAYHLLPACHDHYSN